MQGTVARVAAARRSVFSADFSFSLPEPLPSGWEECFDAGSGRSYYKNHLTQTTSWDRPVSTAAAYSASGFAPSPYASPYAAPPAPTVYPASWDAPAPYSGFAPPPQQEFYQPQPTAFVYPQVAYRAAPPSAPPHLAIVLEQKPAPLVIALQSPVIVSSGVQRVHFRSAHGHYFCADMHQGGLLLANRKSAKGWETFILEPHGTLAALVCEGRYRSADHGGGSNLHANRDRAKVSTLIDFFSFFVSNFFPRIGSCSRLCTRGQAKWRFAATRGNFCAPRAGEAAW
jgi:hypothetical protein